MKYIRSHLTKTVYFITTLLFATFITAPSALAASAFTWTNDTTGNPAMSGQTWQAVSSSSNGQDLAAVVSGGDIWTSTDGGTNWTNDTTGNPAMSGQTRQAVSSSSNGAYVYALVSVGDIWIGYDASLAASTSDSSSPAGSNSSSSSSSSAKAPDTGYGTPSKSDLNILGLGSIALISVTAGVSLLYIQKRTKSHQ